ncbi:ImmA/IrrE family metallo-endopeptidase [Corynebacterium jeikeium]|nr:ImmA/IrrE family metallo-endopeptidase [Corynebacterium jeikeium]ASE56637.1 ImmA/IrrE family metallo-endopeptidase [Corynebacterium jeikeium]
MTVTTTTRKTPSLTTDDLHQLAEELGVTITTHDRGPKGWYHHHTRTISLRSDLRAANYRCTLAHELAHALRGDEPTGNPHFDARSERAADYMAAEMLISRAEYELAERLHDGHEGAIARELGVTRHLLATWKKMHERVNQ